MRAFGNLERCGVKALSLEWQNPWVMPAGLHKAEQIPGCEPGRCTIDERMAIHLIELHQGLVYHDSGEFPGARMHQGKCRDRAWRDAQNGLHLLRFTEAQPAKAQPFGERLEIDLGVVLGDDQRQPASLVPQKEVLRVRAGAGNGAAQGARLLHREHGLVFDCFAGDPELFKPDKEQGGC